MITTINSPPFVLMGSIPRAYLLPRAQGASAISSVSQGHAHLALGRWLIPFSGLERKNMAVLSPDHEARVGRSMA